MRHATMLADTVIPAVRYAGNVNSQSATIHLRGQLLANKVLEEISIASVKFMNRGWAEQIGFYHKLTRRQTEISMHSGSCEQ